jgi:ribosomal protein S18 acetylase RimI-like enzyme
MELTFRDACTADLPALVQMLADDKLGAQREDTGVPLNPRYAEIFAAIEADPNNQLVVVERDAQAVGMLQLTFIPYLSHTGTWRALIEAVRIHSRYRGQGLGERLFAWAIDRARVRGCRLVQLTSDKQRPDAIRFYRSLGFRDSHEGFKLEL